MLAPAGRTMLRPMEVDGQKTQACSSWIPCVMLMLRGGPREAGGLRELLAAFGFRRQSAEIERTLRTLLHEGLVEPVALGVAEEGSGVPCYTLTAEGQQWLADRSETLSEPARLVARFLDRYPCADVNTTSATGGGGSSEAVG